MAAGVKKDSKANGAADRAVVLALLASGRKKGFTASLLQAAIEGAQSIDGIEIEFVHLHHYTFGPCTSCFACIRSDAHRCILRDAMGGDGELMTKIRQANGWILADPVHCWGTSAQTHLFIERCYPFIWSGELEGMPFASISCASNQGMHRLANANLAKWAFTYGLRYVGGLPVHTTFLERALQKATELGRSLARAALQDAQQGRTKYPDAERYVDSLGSPWSVLEPYLDNLTNGKLDYDASLIAQGLDSFQQKAARVLLQRAQRHLQQALAHYRAGNQKGACTELVRASALWTHATWQEFLQEDVIRAGVPEAYRPIIQ